MNPCLARLGVLEKWYALMMLSLAYLLAELGHFLVGVTSRATATDLHYGDKACQRKHPKEVHHPQCETLNDEAACKTQDYCVWDYDGLGIEYQILAGPSFIAVFTIAGIIWGLVADRFNRVRMLAIGTVMYGLAVMTIGSSKEYWQLVILRMVLAAGEAACSPMSTGILSDLFSEKLLGLVMSIYNWGVYGGYGLAFPVGRYVTDSNLWGAGWRACYYIAGAAALSVALLTWITVREPRRIIIGEEKVETEAERAKNPWLFMVTPRILLLCVAASVRQCSGTCFAYNCDLFYRTYYPETDLAWPLFVVTVIVGGSGVLIGGILSDRLVDVMGVRGRLLVLAVSQLIATPFSFGSLYFKPLWAMISLGFSYIFSEMWFGILFATVVEVVPLAVRSTTVGVFLFVMNNIGGNLPVLVDPVSKNFSFRFALYIFFVAFQFASAILFFLTMFLMPKKHTPEELTEVSTSARS